MAAHFEIRIDVIQPLAARHANLLFHQIQAEHRFCYRMLDLNARVHFHEIIIAVLKKKLDRPGIDIIDALGAAHRGRAHLLPQLRRERRRRRFFYELLMLALNRAFALAQCKHIAVHVTDQLHFDVARMLEIFFHVNGRIAERRFRFGLRLLEGIFQLALFAHHAHATPAAARRGFDDHRITKLGGDLQRLFDFRQHTVAARNRRHAGFAHRVFGERLIAHRGDHFRCRPDEVNIARGAHFGEVGILRQKSVAGVNRFGVGDFGGADETRDIQITFATRARPDAHGFIGKAHVQRIGISYRVNRDGFDTQLFASPNDAQGNFAAVRD